MDRIVIKQLCIKYVHSRQSQKCSVVCRVGKLTNSLHPFDYTQTHLISVWLIQKVHLVSGSIARRWGIQKFSGKIKWKLGLRNGIHMHTYTLACIKLVLYRHHQLQLQLQLLLQSKVEVFPFECVYSAPRAQKSAASINFFRIKCSQYTFPSIHPSIHSSATASIHPPLEIDFQHF